MGVLRQEGEAGQCSSNSHLYAYMSAPSARTLSGTRCCVRAFLLVYLRIALGYRRCCSFAFYFYWRFHSIAMVSSCRLWTFSGYGLRLSDRNVLGLYWNRHIHARTICASAINLLISLNLIIRLTRTHVFRLW